MFEIIKNVINYKLDSILDKYRLMNRFSRERKPLADQLIDLFFRYLLVTVT